MAKVKVRGLKSQQLFITSRAKRLAAEAVSDPKLATSIKNLIVNGIRATAKLPDGTPIKGIKGPWGKRRDKLSSINRTNKSFKRFLSNLTFTGQFLGSFRATFSKVGGKIMFEIFPQGKHKGYKQIRGGTAKSVNNADIGKGQIEQGRDYRPISEKNKQLIAKRIIGRIRRELKLRLNF